MGIRDKRGQGFQMASEPRAGKQVRTYISVLDSLRQHKEDKDSGLNISKAFPELTEMKF